MDSDDDSPFGYDAFQRTCPSHTVLEMLASKWVYLVVCALRRGRMRNGELARKLEGITPKMLTQTLRVLERDGLVTRTVKPTTPPEVEYALTALGRSIAVPIAALGVWAAENRGELRAARAAFDGAAFDGAADGVPG